jgi:DNA repair ATPase RecN
LKQRRHSLDSDKLSIIYSASEPESSLAEKPNSHNSLSKDQHSPDQMEELEFLVKEIRRLGLTSEQITYFDKLELLMAEIKKNVGNCQSRLRTMEEQFEDERQGTDEILRALIRMDSSEKELLSNYSDLSNRYFKLQDECEALSS